jgi:hypothetical protein
MKKRDIRWAIEIDHDDHREWLFEEAKRAGMNPLDIALGIWLTAMDQAMTEVDCLEPDALTVRGA